MMFKRILLGTVCISSLLFSSQAEAAMSYEKALQYQAKYPKEIFVSNRKCKDAYGQKNVERFFNMLKKSGVSHSGGSAIVGKRTGTFLNLLINYGFKNIESEPYAYIRWSADLEGDPEKGYAPKSMNIAFEDGFIKSLSLQGWEYIYQEGRGFFGPVWGHHYHGRIRLNEVDLYDIYSHGAIASVSIDDGVSGDNLDGVKHFFYSGEKDLKEKALLTKAFAHTLKILEIDASTIEAKRIAYAKEAEKLRLEQLRKEVEQEIKEEAEREALKKQILEEMKAKQKAK